MGLTADIEGKMREKSVENEFGLWCYCTVPEIQTVSRYPSHANARKPRPLRVFNKGGWRGGRLPGVTFN